MNDLNHSNTVTRPDARARLVLRTLCLYSLILLAILACSASFTMAATFTVTNTNDAGAGSLRQAVLDANAAAGADAIQFSFTSPQTITLTSGELVVTQTLTVTGSSVFPITISGNNSSRIFRATSASSTLSLFFLNLTAGRALASQNLGHGGAITTVGPIQIQNCSISGNSADGLGGAVHHLDTLSLTRSTISGNSAGGSGGGLANEFAGSNGLVVDSTIAYNTSSASGGGIAVNGQAFYSVKNSIIGNNQAANTGPDLAGSVSSQGWNLIKNPSGANITGSQTGNILNQDPQLNPDLAFNHGSTRTHALQSTSPAVDAGDPSRLIVDDQRLTKRGSDGDSDGIRGGDIGAYERITSVLDFDGDESSDLSVIRPVSINSLSESLPEGIQQPIDWYAQTSASSYSRTRFGFDSDIPVPADYDGDGTSDYAVYRPSTGTWLIQGSAVGLHGFRWGISSDTPVPADYDGDGRTDVAVFRAGVWYILNSQLGFTGTVTLGQPTDKPVPADYDGDGKADIAVFTGTHWTAIRSTAGPTSDNFGIAGDIPVPADYDGDGKANLAVFRPTNRTWYYARNTGVPAQNFESLPFGLSTDTLVPADYDADGKTDIAVFRNGVWYINATRGGLIVGYFGLTGDTPIANLLIP